MVILALQQAWLISTFNPIQPWSSKRRTSRVTLRNQFLSQGVVRPSSLYTTLLGVFAAAHSKMPVSTLVYCLISNTHLSVPEDLEVTALQWAATRMEALTRKRAQRWALPSSTSISSIAGPHSLSRPPYRRGLQHTGNQSRVPVPNTRSGCKASVPTAQNLLRHSIEMR